MRSTHKSLLAAITLAWMSPWTLAQPLDAPSTDPAATKAAKGAESGGKPALQARLIDPEKKASKRGATVQAEALNVNIIDPAVAGERPAPGQAHFHYQVDTGPVVASTVSKLSFHELAPGPHLITVTLAGNDHQPIAPPVVLPVRVP